MQIERPKHLTRVLDWDMDWCFFCDHSCARCPLCNTNDCACGCTQRNGEEPIKCQSWWDTMQGREWQIAREMYFRPSLVELVEHIKWLENLDTDMLTFTGLPTKVIEHARWHGVKIGFHMEGEVWKIWLISEPDGEPRNHILTREKAEDRIRHRKERAEKL